MGWTAHSMGLSQCCLNALGCCDPRNLGTLTKLRCFEGRGWGHVFDTHGTWWKPFQHPAWVTAIGSLGTLGLAEEVVLREGHRAREARCFPPLSPISERPLSLVLTLLTRIVFILPRNTFTQCKWSGLFLKPPSLPCVYIFMSASDAAHFERWCCHCLLLIHSLWH